MAQAQIDQTLVGVIVMRLKPRLVPKHAMCQRNAGIGYV
jgi:hypothetical protein